MSDHEYGSFRVSLQRDTLAVPLKPREVGLILREMKPRFPQIEEREISALLAMGDHWQLQGAA